MRVRDRPVPAAPGTDRSQRRSFRLACFGFCTILIIPAIESRNRGEQVGPAGNDMQERRRLAALVAMDVLQSPREPIIHKVLRLARMEFGTSAAAIVLIDRATAVFHTRIGTHARRCRREGWFCNLTIAGCEPLIVQDTATDPRTLALPEVAGAPPARSYAGFPLLTREGLAIGTLALFSPQPDRIAEGREEAGRALASIVMEALELHRLASRDPLTGVMNRRGFMEQLDRDLARSDAEGTPLTLAMVDIDHFKAINDRHGHGAGDTVLRLVAAALAPPQSDGLTVGRIGGEEFAILLRGMACARALPVIEGLRRTIAGLTVPEAPDLRITASFGLADYGSEARTDVQLLARADAALYHSKETGRNRCTLARDLDPA